MTDHITEAERFHNEYLRLRLRTPGTIPKLADVLALANYHATMAVHDAIRETAPKPLEVKTGMTFPPGFASELSAAVMALRGNHTQDAAGDDLSASQPKPGQEDRDEADEQSWDSEACLTCGHSRMGGITLTATDYYALVQRAEKAEAERDAILNDLRVLRDRTDTAACPH